MIVHGDSLEKLKDLEDDSVDLLCTDPPYGYSFMGKAWDKALPDIGIWKECLRVLKPGAFAFVMSAPRSDIQSRMAISLEEAGFVISFTPIYWTYASGFPKAMNIGKKVEAKTIESIEAKALDGSYGGFQPKPAVEVIIVAMKPLSEKTYVDQALKNGKGITWLDDCRVPIGDEVAPTGSGNRKGLVGGKGGFNKSVPTVSTSGRFPANLIVSDDVLNDGMITKSTIDRNPIERGTSKSWFTGDHVDRVQRGDSGSYSRYFSLDAWCSKTFPFLIFPKAAKSEKNRGLDGFEEVEVSDGRPVAIDNAFQRGKTKRVNSHPTVKPLKLMSYLITLGSRTGDVVLDPFCGSGTTCVAAKELGRNFIGIEREEEYVKIAESRIKAVHIPSTLPL